MITTGRPVQYVVTFALDFRTIRKSRRSCYRSCMSRSEEMSVTLYVCPIDHVGNNAETNDTSTVLIDELIDRIQLKNKHLEEHLNDENRAIEDLVCKR